MGTISFLGLTGLRISAEAYCYPLPRGGGWRGHSYQAWWHDSAWPHGGTLTKWRAQKATIPKWSCEVPLVLFLSTGTSSVLWVHFRDVHHLLSLSLSKPRPAPESPSSHYKMPTFPETSTPVIVCVSLTSNTCRCWRRRVPSDGPCCQRLMEAVVIRTV